MIGNETPTLEEYGVNRKKEFTDRDELRCFLLAVYGMPQAKPFEWVMDNGFGYSVRITPQLWQRDKIMEVFSVIPEKKDVED